MPSTRHHAPPTGAAVKVKPPVLRNLDGSSRPPVLRNLDGSSRGRTADVSAPREMCVSSDQKNRLPPQQRLRLPDLCGCMT
jgi:hypothetical protein